MKQARTVANYLGSLLLALVLSTIIWLNATEDQDPVRNEFLQLPVSFVGQSENSILDRPDIQTVQVRVEGPDSILRELTPLDFSAFVDLSQTPFGERVTLPIQVNSNRPEIAVSAPIPQQVEVLLEQQVSQDIPVELDIRGGVARGHVQGDPLIEPAFITVSGPSSSVEQLNFALATVFLNEARETSVADYRPIFYDERGRVASTNNLELSTEQVRITIPVEESAGFAEKLITVNWVGDPAPGYRLLSVTVDPPSVLVRGLPARVSALTRLATEPIDITGLTQTFSQQVTLALPDGISLDQDQEVFVNIEIEPILSTGTRQRAVEVLGRTPEMEIALDPEEVRVVLFGPLPVLDSLVDEDVRVTVDVFGLGSGTHSLEPLVDLPDRGLEVRSIQPQTIMAVITRTITPTEEISGTLPTPQTNQELLRHLSQVPEAAAQDQTMRHWPALASIWSALLRFPYQLPLTNLTPAARIVP